MAYHKATRGVITEADLRTPTLQGVCKDCGNGTLNNELNPAFDTYDDTQIVVCNRCGSSHVDVIAF